MSDYAIVHAMETTYLLAVSAPQHITLAVEQFREDIFKKSGAVSALALEAVIPVAFLKEPAIKNVFADTVLPDENFTITRLLQQNNTYYLGIQPVSLFMQISSKLHGDTAHSLFDTAPGFFLAFQNSFGGSDSTNTPVEIPPAFSLPPWENMSLKLFGIEYADKSLWWEEVNWFVLWERRLKKAVPDSSAGITVS